MNELAFWYYIRSDLPPHAESPAAIGAKFLDTLDNLSCIDPTIFANWKIMDYPARASLPLAAARPRIAAMIENNVYRNDLGEPRPDQGYTAGALVINDNKSRRISLRVHTGGKKKGDTWLQTGEWNVLPDPAIVTYSIFKAALLAINANWPPPWACACAFRSNTVKVPERYPGGVQGYRLERLPPVASDPTFPYSVFHIPWLAYLSAPLAGGVELPPEILTERMPDGGLLMIATEERLDPSDPEHLRRARILAEIMITRTGYSPS